MIKNLLFDLGGVIMDINRNNAIDALTRAGMRDPASLLGDYGQKGPFLALEKGEISPAQFRDELRKYFTCPVTDEEIDHAFCKFLIGIPAQRLHALEALKHKGYAIYLLSNTNALMWNEFILPEFCKDGHNINHYFKGIITSFEVKAYKPDPAIFAAAVDRLGIAPTETIFYDDSQANLEGASLLGFHTRHVTDENDMITLTSTLPAITE